MISIGHSHVGLIRVTHVCFWYYTTPLAHIDIFVSHTCTKAQTLHGILSESEALAIAASTYGFKGKSAFSRLPYFDLAKDMVLDYMHFGKNIGHQMCECLVGYDYSGAYIEKTKKAFEEFGMHHCIPSGEDRPHWSFQSSDVRREAERAIMGAKAPRSWGLDFKYALTGALVDLCMCA